MAEPTQNWTIPAAWVPVSAATTKLNLTLYEIAQLLAEARDPPRIAVKVESWKAMRLPGLRSRLLARKRGDPTISDAAVDAAELSLSGFYLLHEPSVLAMRWPKRCDSAELLLWTDTYPLAASPDDLLLPKSGVSVSMEEIYFHPQDVGGIVREVNTQAKETLLSIIGTLAQAAGYDIHTESKLMPAAKLIAQQCEQAGVAINPRTVWTHLKDARDKVRRMKTSGAPMKTD